MAVKSQSVALDNDLGQPEGELPASSFKILQV